MPRNKKKTHSTNIHDILFDDNNVHGRIFDLVITCVILFSVFILVLESIESLGTTYATLFFIIEAIITLIFTIEYLMRLKFAKNSKEYAFSFYGIIDFLSLIPFYLMIFFSGAQAFAVIRILRLFRLMRIFKMAEALSEAEHLVHAIKNSIPKIGIFIITICFISLIFASILTIIEANTPGFSSIPEALYYTILIITTMGFGEVLPQTLLGQSLTAFLILLGYGVIAVPTGIITVELISKNKKSKIKLCGDCEKTNSEENNYCYNCGARL